MACIAGAYTHIPSRSLRTLIQFDVAQIDPRSLYLPSAAEGLQTLTTRVEYYLSSGCIHSHGCNLPFPAYTYPDRRRPDQPTLYLPPSAERLSTLNDTGRILPELQVHIYTHMGVTAPSLPTLIQVDVVQTHRHILYLPPSAETMLTLNNTGRVLPEHRVHIPT